MCTLLLSEPAKGLLSVGLQALKISVSKQAKERPFWQARYYDFNVFRRKTSREAELHALESCETGTGGET
jgi:hypothetical protein